MKKFNIHVPADKKVEVCFILKGGETVYHYGMGFDFESKGTEMIEIGTCHNGYAQIDVEEIAAITWVIKESS